MRSRTAVSDMFSTFVRFAGDRFESWMTDKRLANRMQQLMKEANHTTDSFWVLHWYQQWQKQENRHAIMHLCAYLQEPCYWAAENVTQRFVSVQYTLADAFQVAIACLEKVLARYDPTYGSSLSAYARTAFGNLIRNQLRQQKTANICSDWGLLRKLSKIQLNQSLRTAGFAKTDTDILIWQCFKAVCIPDASRIGGRAVRTLGQPTSEQLTQIAERYHSQRPQGNQQMAATVTTEAVLESLQKSAKAVRSQLNPNIASLNQLQYSDGKELIDDLTTSQTPMGSLLAVEAYNDQQQKMQAVGAVLTQAITRLDPAMQTLLQLYYQQQLTQKDIANQLQIKQYQVSRNLSRVRRQLLLDVAKWSQEALHISIDSTVLANMSEVIHEWLQRHYASKDPSGDAPFNGS